MTRLSEIIPLADLRDAIADGYVRLREHPLDPRLIILNYTEKAQYENVWTTATRNARGLIVRLDDVDGDGDVLARPWPKFFNYGQHDEGTLDLTARVEVTDKMDGSLGILYLDPDGLPAIATRGSFTSEQAVHATDALRLRYAPILDDLAETATSGLTLLFEIVYPDNRIVVDYGPQDDLVFLGAVVVDDGATIGVESTFPWLTMPRTQVFPAATLADALALPPRPNAEGVVVRYPATDVMVKLKQDDYVRLHRIVTGLNERAVWEHLRDHDGAYDELLAAVPDEFHGWVCDKAGALRDRYFTIAGDADRTWQEITSRLPAGYTRKDFAAEAVRSEHRPLLFLIEDGRSVEDAIWRQLRPVGETASLMNRTEDVA